MENLRFIKLLRWLMILIAIVAGSISALLFYRTLGAGLILPGCGAGSGCDVVFQSGWGNWFSVPVASFAVGIYVLVIALLFNSFYSKHPSQRRIANYGLIVCAVAIFLTALWFIAVQLFVIGAICKYCMSVHVLGLILAVLILGSLWPNICTTKQKSMAKNRLQSKLVIAALALGVIGAAVLAVGEVFSHAPRARIAGYGDIAINVQHYPVIGSRDAKHIMVLFADYTCPFCRQMHHYIKAAIDHFGESELAVVIAPMPLDSKCNPYVKHTTKEHEGGCELAKIALAVWHIAPSKFAQIDSWLFGADHKRTIKSAMQKAQQLTGKDGAAIKKVMNQKWLKEFLHAQTQLNYILGQQAKVSGVPVGDRIPKLILSKSFMEVGRPASKQDFFNELKSRLIINN